MRRDRLIRMYARERFVITLKSGQTFDGLIEDHDESTIELVDANSVTREARTPVDGRLYLPRADIAYMQRPVAQ
ncbi:MAG: hypothetical protein ACXV3F_00260 [Frankiaceae bacterium]